MLTHKFLKMKFKKPVLPEELIPKSITFKSAFWVVVAAHLAVIATIYASPLIKSANYASDKKLLQEPMYVGVPEPTPAATPVPVVVTTQTVNREVVATNNTNWPQGKLTEKVIHKQALTKEYTVKYGDTFYSIVKKYKLDPVKLQKINDIKDPNRLFVGQRLKFVK